jgi:co-chaperonin GroES (HSP10)|tara:strand:- start:93 stop:476 length:384 start_codon:yes stop_codon:yes gene_type:complete
MAIGLKSNINRIHCKSLRAISDKVIVHGMDFGAQTLASGIIMMDDDKKSQGIKPRWAQVYSIGPLAQPKTELQVGQYVLVGHGRWTRGINIVDEEGEKTIRAVDLKDCMLVSDEPQNNMAFGDKEGA